MKERTWMEKVEFRLRWMLGAWELMTRARSSKSHRNSIYSGQSPGFLRFRLYRSRDFARTQRNFARTHEIRYLPMFVPKMANLGRYLVLLLGFGLVLLTVAVWGPIRLTDHMWSGRTNEFPRISLIGNRNSAYGIRCCFGRWYSPITGRCFQNSVRPQSVRSGRI